MSIRREGFRGAPLGAVPPFVLPWAVLLGVLMWVLPVCVHASGGFVTSVGPPQGMTTAHVSTAHVSTAHVPTTSVSPAYMPAAPPEGDDTCADVGHSSGDEHCRPAADAVATTASPVDVPPPPPVGLAVAAGTPRAVPARAAPAVLPRAPGIHQLQVQRI
ncbi:hypothetical protein SZN_20227 [Streptomyces zinciresistens K42]|uniref:Uncharacterized protein n=1 Tax=Streptomyces zinciresistens K42 TaxID=700597 RepID=G2GEW2_9ACTN|nr:hypothetical protein [Streptomyces zinciresistens]EGX57971.1 hypothetical protein SZN_20227 [Streptomyces zinciresistens K42]